MEKGIILWRYPGEKMRNDAREGGSAGEWMADDNKFSTDESTKTLDIVESCWYLCFIMNLSVYFPLWHQKTCRKHLQYKIIP